MAKADQLRSLLKAYAHGDEARFHAVAMQIAANEARAGHGKLAEELRALVDQAKVRVPKPTTNLVPNLVPLAKPRGEVADLLSVSYPNVRLSSMVLAADTKRILERVLKEHRNLRDIRDHGLAPRKKLLLLGPPGTGKTLTASALAGELGLPLFVVRFDRLITRYMGETAAKLRLVFDAIAQTRAVYLFDEFDSIGSERGLSNDVGEIRRVDSLIIAATNHAGLLDKALFRRFDDIVEYAMPTVDQVAEVLKSKLSGFKSGRRPWKALARSASGLSYGDLTRAVEDAVKHAIVERRAVTKEDLADALAERKAAARPKKPNRSRK